MYTGLISIWHVIYICGGYDRLGCPRGGAFEILPQPMPAPLIGVGLVSNIHFRKEDFIRHTNWTVSEN